MSMKTKKNYLTFSPRQTLSLAEKLARDILRGEGKENRRQKAFLVGLEGNLGGGKTTFLKGFAKGLGIKERILSPTFVIIRRFQLNNLTIKQFDNFYHIDCYRIEKPEEILTLGFKKIISDPKNIVCIEWADKIKKILPKETLWIKFEIKNKNQRKISIFGNQKFKFVLRTKRR